MLSSIINYVLCTLSSFVVCTAQSPHEKLVVSSISDLPFDENGRLSSHLLVYPEGACANFIEDDSHRNQPFRELYAVSGEALSIFFGGTGIADVPKISQDCPAACLERGVEKSQVGTPLPSLYFDREQKFDAWFTTACNKAEQCYINYHKKDASLKVYWVNPYTNENRFTNDLQYGEKHTHCIETWLGHEFIFEDSETGEIVMRHTIEFTGVRAIGVLPRQSLPTNRDFHERIKSTLNGEWRRQGAVQRTFSSLGFAKGRLPEDIFGTLGAYYYNNRNFTIREEWDGKGVFVNWWEVDVHFIQLPWGLKQMLQERLKTMVEEWTGVDLEETSMYGLRQYEEGARLLTHVDRTTTHAASLIVNVAQGNVTEPWAVEVHDHAGRLHQVNMEPGDIVYYESAKCLHGRNTPLKGPGAYYVNLFTHYRPTGDANWYKKDNPEGTPDPLIEIGDCKVEESSNEPSQGPVICENSNIGPYLSPSLLTATSGDDLYQWWRRVGPMENELDRDEL
mmetsp:Transcript_36583/g.44157  ORF Transcript_36583/g.44157 Transcript_36583/m.44157 type:complete len:507 (-) Transcript_36583:32-1552(-)